MGRGSGEGRFDEGVLLRWDAVRGMLCRGDVVRRSGQVESGERVAVRGCEECDVVRVREMYVRDKEKEGQELGKMSTPLGGEGGVRKFHLFSVKTPAHYYMPQRALDPLNTGTYR